MLLWQVLGSLLIGLVVSYNLAFSKMEQTKITTLKEVNIQQVEQFKDIKEGVKSYCNDVTTTLKPTLSLLDSSGYYKGVGKNLWEKTYSLSWSSNTEFKISFDVTNPFDTKYSLMDVSNNYRYKFFGTIPVCELDELNVNFGKCSVVIPIGINCNP
jgi:hypothetical protein